ncbi:MAG: GNAT family N-acetyltransferase [Alphaproteobacteria bacterium]|nr:GNAT family N-acetyltransferase [Alphaproteobacteria bacterium]
MDLFLKTVRLTLRPFRPDDAPAVQALAGNWKVARMTAHIPHPYPDGLAEAWIAGHDAARAETAAYPFAFEELGADRMLARHHVDNTASGRVLRKCGFRYLNDGYSWSSVHGRDVPIRQFVLTRDQAVNQPGPR